MVCRGNVSCCLPQAPTNKHRSTAQGHKHDVNCAIRWKPGTSLAGNFAPYLSNRPADSYIPKNHNSISTTATSNAASTCLPLTCVSLTSSYLEPGSSTICEVSVRLRRKIYSLLAVDLLTTSTPAGAGRIGGMWKRSARNRNSRL